jgi:hypothetical protein
MCCSSPDPNKPTPYGLFSQWDGNVAKKTLWARERLGLHCFTGAYMIKIENYRGKIESCCDQISKQWEVRGRLFDRVLRCKTLEAAWKIFKQIEYIGGFMAYEIVTDLRHTYLLNEATDINTWCNLGPGAMRGISRLFNPDGRTPSKIESKNSLPKDILGTLRMLRDAINLKLTELNDCAEPSEDPDDGKLEFTYPLFEMRELEHTLCEFDKYERARLGQGTMKRKYPGTK